MFFVANFVVFFHKIYVTTLCVNWTVFWTKLRLNLMLLLLKQMDDIKDSSCFCLSMYFVIFNMLTADKKLYLTVGCVFYLVTHMFRVNLHYIIVWMLLISLLKTGATSKGLMNAQLFSQTSQMIELCCEYLSVLVIDCVSL